jgi:hypothetical protein
MHDFILPASQSAHIASTKPNFQHGDTATREYSPTNVAAFTTPDEPSRGSGPTRKFPHRGVQL